MEYGAELQECKNENKVFTIITEHVKVHGFDLLQM